VGQKKKLHFVVQCYDTIFKAKSQDIPVLSTSPWRCM